MLVRNALGETVAQIPIDWLVARLSRLKGEGVPLSPSLLLAVVRQWIEDERRETALYHGMHRMGGWEKMSAASGPRMDLELHDALDGRERP